MTSPVTHPFSDRQAGARCVLVLGMHRSGTSALTRVLNLAGAGLGDSHQLFPAHPTNETGFWERRDVVALNDELMQRLGYRWDDPRALPESWWQDAALNDLRERLSALIAAEFRSTTMWALKDPRLCRLLPLWQSLLGELQVAPQYVFALRHPAEVAASLARRDGFSLTKSLLLWLRHVLEAEHTTRGATRVFVEYEQLLADPAAVTDVLSGFLDSVGVPDPAARHAANAFVSPHLRHHQHTAADWSAPTALSIGLVEHVHAALCRGARGGAPDTSVLDAAALALKELDGLLLPTATSGITAISQAPSVHPATRSRKALQELEQLWIVRHAPTPAEQQLLVEQLQQPGLQVPVLHLVVTDAAGDGATLSDTLGALAAQNYPALRVTVVSVNPPPPGHVDDGALLWVRVTHAGELVPTVNGAVQAVPAEWIGLLAAGDRLDPRALATLALSLRAHPDWRYLYTDEACLTHGRLSDLRFKPEFNLEYLRAMPYVGSFALVERQALTQCGGYQDCAGHENYDLLFRLLDSHSSDAIGHVAAVCFHQASANRARLAHERADNIARAIVAQHLERRGLEAEVLPGAVRGTQQVNYRLQGSPQVSVIIPTKDRLDLIQPCVESLLEKTSYANYEVLVMDNGSSEPAVLGYFEHLRATQSRVRVVAWPHPYNFSAINNAAAELARGDYLVLLNNDTAVLEPDWLTRLIALGQQADVGIVGCRLLYPDGDIQHGGVVVGLSGAADHPFQNRQPDEPGYMNRLQVPQDLSAVTAACLLIRKSVYAEVGGLDAERFQVLFNDVDLCLKVRERGLRVVWTPHATLMHHGSSSLRQVKKDAARVQRERAETFALADRWMPWLANDPAYNRHLSLSLPGYEPELATSAPWPPGVLECPRVLVLGAGNLAQFMEGTLKPLQVLEQAGQLLLGMTPFHAAGEPMPQLPHGPELLRLNPDVLLIHNGLSDRHLTQIANLRRYCPARFIFSYDAGPGQGPARPDAETLRRLQQMLASCDRLIVVQPALAAVLAHCIRDIRLVSSSDPETWRRALTDPPASH